MRFVFSIMFALSFFLICPAFAYDEEHGPDAYAVRGVKSDDVLNIRILPDPQSKKIGDIPYNGRGIKPLHCVNDVPLSIWLELSEEERDKIYQKR